MAHEQDNTAASILHTLMFKDGHSTQASKILVPHSLFLSIDRRVYPSAPEEKVSLQKHSHILEQPEEESCDVVPTGRFGNAPAASRQSTTSRKNEQSMVRSRHISPVMNEMPSSIRKTLSRVEHEDNQPTLPKRSIFTRELEEPSGRIQILIISLTVGSDEYEVYYKHEGTVKEFLAYMSRLRNDRDLDSSLCVNSYTLEILALDLDLSEFKDTRVSLELVDSNRLLKASWKKVSRNRYEVENRASDQKQYWLSSTDILKEYELNQTSQKVRKHSQHDHNSSKIWYFNDHYITEERAKVVRNDLATYFPDISLEEAELLARDDIKGFKIYKNLTYYLSGIGLQVNSISSATLSKASYVRFREISKERHEQKNNLERVMKFLVLTGFSSFARSLHQMVKSHFELDFEQFQDSRQTVINEFLVQYGERKISSQDFVDLLQQLMKNKERHCEFLRDAWIYEFRELKRPCTESIEALKMHNFESYEDWFFPTLDVVSLEEATHIKASLTAGKNIIEAYRHYLQLFDLELSDSYAIRKRSTSMDKFKHPLNKHRHLERLVVSLSVMGFRPVAQKFLTFLKSIKSLTSNWAMLPDLESEAKIPKVYGCDPDYLKDHHLLVKRQLQTCSLI